MRKTKRFTPAVLERFERQERSEGIYEDYLAWHQVTRGDPSSRGRSHILKWRGRLRDFLSDGEMRAHLFGTMLPNLDDSLENFKLTVGYSVHLLARYGSYPDPYQLFPGTEAISKQLEIRHPELHGTNERCLWNSSTDLVLIFKDALGTRSMLAIAFKPNDWSTNKRTIELLRLEREFWIKRNVPWLLITPQLYDDAVAKALCRTACWALAEEVSQDRRQLACQIANRYPFGTVTELLYAICAYTQSMEIAQRALWQAIWKGELPIDLRRGWRPHVPLKHLSHDAFMQLNPIASRRSSWI